VLVRDPKRTKINTMIFFVRINTDWFIFNFKTYSKSCFCLFIMV